MKLDWRGPAVHTKVMRATAEAIDDTTEDAAKAAQASHWWGSQSGTLQGEIVNEPAKTSGTRVVGKFGSTKGAGFYGLFHEYKTPFLRPAADSTFPTLARRIRAKL